MTTDLQQDLFFNQKHELFWPLYRKFKYIGREHEQKNSAYESGRVEAEYLDHAVRVALSFVAFFAVFPWLTAASETWNIEEYDGVTL